MSYLYKQSIDNVHNMRENAYPVYYRAEIQQQITKNRNIGEYDCACFTDCYKCGSYLELGAFSSAGREYAN